MLLIMLIVDVLLFNVNLSCVSYRKDFLARLPGNLFAESDVLVTLILTVAIPGRGREVSAHGTYLPP